MLTNAYAEVDEFKATMARGVTMSDSNIAAIERALTTASRRIEKATGWSRFWKDSTVQVRTFRPDYSGELCVPIGIASASGLVVKTDPDANGTYDTTWTSGTHFTLQPSDALTDGWPYTSLDVIGSSGYYFPGAYDGRDTVQITAIFGWPEVPAEVKEACILEATTIWKSPEAPFGAATLGDTGLGMRIRGMHPTAWDLVKDLAKPAVG